MNELKQQLMDKLGLDEGLSDQAIQLVLGFVKDKLPENLQGMVDSIAAGETPDLGDVGDLGGALDTVKGLFGGK